MAKKNQSNMGKTKRSTRRPEELDVPAASLLRNLYSEIQAQPLDILAAHAYDF